MMTLPGTAVTCHQCCNQSKFGKEALSTLIGASEPASASDIAGVIRESFLKEVVLELVLKVKELWVIEIAP